MFPLTLFRMGERGKKAPPLLVFPYNFYKRKKLAQKTFWLLVLTLLKDWCKISSFVPSASPKLLNLNQDHPSKKAVFLVKSL